MKFFEPSRSNLHAIANDVSFIDLLTNNSIRSIISKGSHGWVHDIPRFEMFLIGFYGNLPWSTLKAMLSDKSLCETLPFPFSITFRPASIPYQDFINFRRNQAYFVGDPYFKQGVFDQEIEFGTTISICCPLGRGERGRGHGGQVFEAKIFTEYHNITPSRDAITVAIKIVGYTHPDKTQNEKKRASVRREFKTIADLMKAKNVEKVSVATYYSSFEFRDKTYIMAEMADMNLQEFMGRPPLGSCD